MNGDPRFFTPTSTPYGSLDYLADPGSMRPYYAPPVYSPLQNPAHIDNMYGYLANMYGPALVEGFAGPDAFLAHQAPGQHLMDQVAAAHYQRNAAEATYSANRMGSSIVAQKLLGWQAAMNGGQTVTQLDREHASVGANVINNPIFKGFGAQMIGPENLEGLMFGRAGDPSAIVNAMSRIGYYRPDAATGATRTGGQSLDEFSTALYRNLYGPDADLDKMHGFGAVATGEMMEHLFQQGRLPQSIGALSPAARVDALSSTKRDNATLTELAREFGHRDLMARNYDYANATDEEQKLMLDDRLDGYKKKISDTFTEIDKFAAGDKRAKSAEEIERLDGFSIAANSFDAARTSDVLKKYNGAVAAIRELFGDNGRTDAPINELLASLQHMTNGAQTQMSASGVEKMVRGIRAAARDSNTDYNELMTVIQHDKAVGASLGLTETTVERGIAGRLFHEQSMRDAGVFEKAAPGKLNAKAAAEYASQMSLRGDASATNNSLAVLNRAVTESPEQFKGTAAEAAAKAYRAGEKTYVDPTTGDTVNLAKMAAHEGPAAILQILKDSGASNAQVHGYLYDTKGNQPYSETNYTFRNIQPYEVAYNVARSHAGRIRADLDSVAKPAGMTDDEFAEYKVNTADAYAEQFVEMVIQDQNVMADMTHEQRADHMERRGLEILADHFQQIDPNLTNAQADRQAEEYFTAIHGPGTTDKERAARRGNLMGTYAGLNIESTIKTGIELPAQFQIHAEGAHAMAAARERVSERRNDRLAAVSAGTESTVAQRVGEELDRLGSGDAVTIAEAMSRIMNVQSKDEMLQKLAPDMQGGLVVAAEMHSKAVTTPEQIDALIAESAKNPGGSATKELERLAGHKPGDKLTDEQKTTLNARAMKAAAYMPAGKTPAEQAANKRKADRADMLIRAYNTGMSDDIEAGARAYATEILGENASQSRIDSFTNVLLTGDTQAIMDKTPTGFFGGFTDKQRQDALHISDALRAARDVGGLQSVGLDQTPQSLDAAEDRPTAVRNMAKRAVVPEIQRDLTQRTKSGTIFSSAYDKLRPDGMSREEFARRKTDLTRYMSEEISSTVIDRMGNGARMTPEERADFMERQIKLSLAKHFKQVNPDLTDERREELATEHFDAMYGTDKKKKVAALDQTYNQVVKTAQTHGFDAAEIRPNDVPIADVMAGNASGTSEGRKAYYKQLGVTEQLSKEQEAVFKEVTADPSGKKMTAAMRDTKKRQLLLTMPDAAAVEVFDRMSPEAQTMMAQQMAGAGQSRFLNKKEKANIARIQGAVMEAQQQRMHQAEMPPQMFMPGGYPAGPLMYGPQQQGYGPTMGPLSPSPLAQQITTTAGADIYGFLEEKSRDPRYAKLRGSLPKNEFDERRKDIMAELGVGLAGTVINEMGMGDVIRPEERVAYMSGRAKQILADRFLASGAKTEEEAAAMAETHFAGIFGTDDKDIAKGMDQIYQHTRSVAQRSGGLQSANMYAPPGYGPAPIPMSPEAGYAMWQMVMPQPQAYEMQMQDEFAIARDETARIGAPTSYTKEDYDADMAKYGTVFERMGFGGTGAAHYSDPNTGESASFYRPPSAAKNAPDSRFRQRQGLSPSEPVPTKDAPTSQRRAAGARPPLPRLSTYAPDPNAAPDSSQKNAETAPGSTTTFDVATWADEHLTKLGAEKMTASEQLILVQKEMDQLEADSYRGSYWGFGQKKWTTPEAQQKYEELRARKIELARPIEARMAEVSKYGWESETTIPGTGKPLPMPTVADVEQSVAGKKPEDRLATERRASQIIARHLTPEDEARLRLSESYKMLAKDRARYGNRNKSLEDRAFTDLGEVAIRELAREQGIEFDESQDLDIRTSVEDKLMTAQGKDFALDDVHNKMQSIMQAAGFDPVQGTITTPDAVLSPTAARYREQLHRVEQAQKEVPTPTASAPATKPVIPSDVSAWGSGGGETWTGKEIVTPTTKETEPAPAVRTRWKDWNQPEVIKPPVSGPATPSLPPTPTTPAAVAPATPTGTAQARQAAWHTAVENARGGFDIKPLPAPPVPKSAAVIDSVPGADSRGGRAAPSPAAANNRIAQMPANAAGTERSSDVNVTGTLVLQGLSEAVIKASGQRMEDTHGGPPIDLGKPTYI